jgi:glycosyltransferase involved in cell wall biosynthesis
MSCWTGRERLRMRLAAVIPAYDAEASVGDIVRRTRAVIADVLVVDDGSHDRTGAMAREAGARVIRHEVNRGKGCALQTGFAEVFAGRAPPLDGVLTIDADGQHLPEEVPKLLVPAARGADLVLGTRDALFAQMSPVRRTSNRLSSWAISRAAGARLPDVQTGFRFYSRRLYERIGFPPGRFDSESAVVVLACRAGLVLAGVPVRLGFADGRCTSHYRPMSDSVRIAGAVIRARLAPILSA